MSRFGILVLVAVVAFAQASLPTNRDQNGAKAVTTAPAGEKAKPLCKDCEKILTALKKILQNPDLEAKLITTLKDICNFALFPEKVKQRCLDIGNNIIVVLHELQGLVDDPAGICEYIKICSTETSSINSVSKKFLLAFASKIVQDVKPPTPTSFVDTCSLCTSALNELKRILETPEIVIKIQNGMEKVCKYAGKYQDDCKAAIELYFPKLLQIAIDALCQPEETCSAIKLCKRSQTEAFLALSRSNRVAARPHPAIDRLIANISNIQTFRGVNMGCFACKASITAAIDVLSRDKVLSMIATDATDFICKLIPSSLAPGCYDFLGIYAKAALQLTLNEWTPSEICAAMRACTSTTFMQEIRMTAVEKSVAVCDACKIASRVLAFELEKPEFQQEIIDVLTRGCSILPAKFANKVRCETYAETYLPYILENIVALTVVPKICTVVHLC